MTIPLALQSCIMVDLLYCNIIDIIYIGIIIILSFMNLVSQCTKYSMDSN